MNVIVSNTSPLIILAKAGLLGLLPKLSTEIFIPSAVYAEILAGDDDDAMRLVMPNCAWLRVVPLDPPLSPLATMHLGRGESEALELARRHPNSLVLLDDRAGRRTAQALGLRVFGTLSVVAASSQRWHVDSFGETVSRLRDAGLYVTDALVDAIQKGLAKRQ